MWYALPLLRRHRLTARTPGSHPGNRGSIPRGVTKKLYESWQANIYPVAVSMAY